MATSVEERTGTGGLNFHVPPDSGPDDTLALLRMLHEHPELEFTTYKELCASAEEHYGAGGHQSDAYRLAQLAQLIFREASDAGGKSKSGRIMLTELGRFVFALRDERRVEVIHFLLYTGWERDGAVPLWSYRAVCDVLWERGLVNLAQMGRQTMNEVIGRIDEQFSGTPDYNPSKLSFSPKSIKGVTKWLERLHPPAVRQGIFEQRGSAGAELLLLAVGWAFRDLLVADGDAGSTANADLWLNQERRAAICRLCLLDPAHLDQLLDWLLSIFPQYIGEGTRAGSMGRFLRLHRLPGFDEAGWVI